MIFEIDDEALAEAEEARAYYAAIDPSLGEQFAVAMDSAIERIVADPKLWSPYTARTRRYVLTRFPYAVIYRVRAKVLRVLAVSHQSRRPGYWRSR